MIEPTEEVPGEFGHPVWKRNAFAGMLLCIIGVVMMVSVFLFVWGFAVFALGAVWTVVACVFGILQERADQRRGPMSHA